MHCLAPESALWPTAKNRRYYHEKFGVPAEQQPEVVKNIVKVGGGKGVREVPPPEKGGHGCSADMQR